MNELAEQELAFVATQLTTEELVELDRRVVAGEITSDDYVVGECGCIYGSIGLIRHALNSTSTFDQGEKYRDAFLGANRSEFVSDYELSPLEWEVGDIALSDTPDTHETSAWLHSLLSAEIQRRQS